MSLEPLPESMEIFFSYAHEDEALRDALEKQLSSLKKQGLIKTWHNRSIVAGADWQRAIDERLNLSNIILLLISPDFIASDYCYSVEMRRALERHESGDARVVPIILRPTDWQSLSVAALAALPGNGIAVTLWENIDAAFLDIARGIRKIVEEFTAKLLVEPQIHHWNVPYRRNAFFTGREEILTALHATFASTPETLTCMQAINGLGGVGKTQVAVEYAYRYQHEYRSVLWMRSDSREDLVTDFIQIADLLNLPQKIEANQALVIAAVKRWLQKHANWLLIFDNVEDLDMLNDFVPLIYRGHILITTRSQATGNIPYTREIEKMEAQEGALFLLRRAKVISPGASSASTSETHNALAQAISHSIDGLPLALDQAGAYIEETGTSLSEYQALFQQKSAALLKRRGRFALDHPASVTTTFLLAFERVREVNSLAAQLLQLCAFLHPDAIPEEIFAHSTQDLHLTVLPHISDTFEFDTAFGTLLDFSLVKRNADTKTLNIHRLVQTVLRNELSKEQQYQWAEDAIKCTEHLFPEVEFATWSLCQRYLAHALVCADFIDLWNISLAESAHLLNHTGRYLYKRAQYADARGLYERALAIREQTLGSEHLDTIESMNRLGELYYMLGKYNEAEKLYKQVLTSREKALGPEHLSIAEILDNLGALYGDIGDYPQAILLFERAVAIRQKLLGPDHIDTADILNNAALPYLDSGNYEKAKPMLMQALSILEKVWTTDTPDAGICRINLAKIELAQGHYNEAEQFLKRALEILKQTLGLDHPMVATCLYYCARVYLAQEKYERAEPLLTQALAINEQSLGYDHPSTAQCLDSLALLSVEREKYTQAEVLYKRALDIREQTLEPYHPAIAQTLENYAALLNKMQRSAAAEELLHSAQERRATYLLKMGEDETG